jgi:hypothetical protein
MEFPDNIYLYNRYNDRNYLVFENQESENVALYVLRLEHGFPIRSGYGEYGCWFDPSGGPFIRKGYTMGNLEVIDVYYNNGRFYTRIKMS